MTTGFLVQPESIKYLETNNGVAFTANLLLNGKIVGTIENNGNGGDTHSRCLGRVNKLLTKEATMWGFVRDENFLDALMDFAEGITDSKTGQ